MHQSVLFVDNRLLSVHLQRQGLCFENASQAQHCCASGLGRCATSIGAVRRQGGSAQAYHSGERRDAFSVRRFSSAPYPAPIPCPLLPSPALSCPLPSCTTGILTINHILRTMGLPIPEPGVVRLLHTNPRR